MLNLRNQLKEKDNFHLFISILVLIAIIILISLFVMSLPVWGAIFPVILFGFIKMFLINILLPIVILLEIIYIIDVVLKSRKNQNINFLKSNKTLHFWFLVAFIPYVLMNSNALWQFGSNILGFNEESIVVVSSPIDEYKKYEANGHKELPKEIPYSYKKGLEEIQVNLTEQWSFKVKDIDENKSLYYSGIQNHFFIYDKTTNQVDVDEKYIDWGFDGYLIDKKYFISTKGMSFSVYDIDERKTTFKSREQFGWGLSGIDKKQKLFYIIEEPNGRNFSWKNFYLFELKDNGELVQKDCIAFFSNNLKISSASVKNEHMPIIYDIDRNLLFTPSVNSFHEYEEVEYKTKIDLNFWRKMNKIFN